MNTQQSHNCYVPFWALTISTIFLLSLIRFYQTEWKILLQILERYLANGNIKGIGEALAKRLVKKFGEEWIKKLYQVCRMVKQ